MSSDSAPPPDDHPIVQTVAEPLQQLLKKNAEERVRRNTGQSDSTTLPFRPTGRQPLVRLTILDDGCRQEGETVRIRSQVFSIGRDDGDLRIPFDADMSGRHAQLDCRFQLGEYRWFLTDLASTNGTFLRAYRVTLRDGAELILGSRRYHFRGPETSTPPGFRPEETISYRPRNLAKALIIMCDLSKSVHRHRLHSLFGSRKDSSADMRIAMSASTIRFFRHSTLASTVTN
ncbi:MAG: FHA domain-containing protein [Planctomycetaceae bacterium]